VSDLLSQLFSSRFFMPHGHCYLWQPGLVWLQVLSNGFIALAYLAISSTLAYLVYRVRDLPFKVMYLAFGAFIVTCGITHIFDVWVIWEPLYWLDGLLRAVTAVASVGTALALPSLIPKVLALARGAKAAHDRGIQLETAIKDLGTSYERARELERMKTQFFANVSHELRTPLALILGPTEKLLTATNLVAGQRQDLAVMQRNARLLLQYVNDLLDVTKIEAGKLEPDYVAVDLARLVRRAASHFETIAAERSIAYAIETPAELQAALDIGKIERVLFNLLSNAFKFTPAGGHIRCTLTVQTMSPQHAEIVVADSGPGIPPASRQAAFERFRQLENASGQAAGGTGLGLAIAKDFTELHGGTIGVGDAPEGGALLRVRLPIAAPDGKVVRTAPAADAATLMEAELVAPAPPAAASPAADAAPDSRVHASIGPDAGEARGERRPQRLSGSMRVHGAPEETLPQLLLVEDNAELRRFLTESLAGAYRVATAEDGAAGLDRALELGARLDLVLTDMMMPRMDGATLVRELRRHEALAVVPIMLLTAKADDTVRIELLRQGAQDYLLKPCSVEELRARVGNLVAMKRARGVLEREIVGQQRDLADLARDVAQRKRELETAYEAMRVAREQAERASELKTRLLGLVSHELRTPLTALRLQLERLERGREPALAPKQTDITRRMAGAMTRLEQLIESLLEYARIERGQSEIHAEAVYLADLAAATLGELGPQAEKKRLRLRLEVTPGLGPAWTDPRHVRLILVNLVANAIKFTEQGEVAVLVGRGEGEAFRVAVRDTGPGIPSEAQERIFEPFSPLEPFLHKHTPGVGLGLALVREMVEGLGGVIEVQSQLGVGSTFTVMLPASAPQRGSATNS
jgi:signal transduction histidine kinase